MQHLSHGPARDLVPTSEKTDRRRRWFQPSGGETEAWSNNTAMQAILAVTAIASAFYSWLALIPVLFGGLWWLYHRNIDERMMISPSPSEVFTSKAVRQSEPFQSANSPASRSRLWFSRALAAATAPSGSPEVDRSS